MTHCDFEKVLSQQLNFLYKKLKERDRRVLLGCTAILIGRDGAVFVRDATGSAKNTVTKSIREMQDTQDLLLDGLSPEELELCVEEASSEESSVLRPDKLDQPMDHDVLTLHKSPKQREEFETVPKQDTVLTALRLNGGLVNWIQTRRLIFAFQDDPLKDGDTECRNAA